MVNLQPAIDLLKEFEGFSSKPYLDVVNVPTIGYGNTYYPDGRKVTMQDPPITEAEGVLLKLDVLNKDFLPAVMRLCPILFARAVMLNDINKICAIVSFAYNVGNGNLQISTLRRRINQQEWEEAANELLKWNKAGGKVFRGLTRRREAERKLFLKEYKED